MTLCFTGHLEEKSESGRIQWVDVVGFRFKDFSDNQIKLFTPQSVSYVTSDRKAKVEFANVFVKAPEDDPPKGLEVHCDSYVYLKNGNALSSDGLDYTTGGYLGTKNIKCHYKCLTYDWDDQPVVVEETLDTDVLCVIPSKFDSGGIIIDGLTDKIHSVTETDYGTDLPPWPSGQWNPGGETGKIVAASETSRLFAFSERLRPTRWKHEVKVFNRRWDNYGYDKAGGPFVPYPYGTNNSYRPDGTRYTPITVTMNCAGLLTENRNPITITQHTAGDL